MTTSKQVKHLHADVIIAWANGAKVQNSENGIDWYDCVGSPGWSPCTKYRVKPKPLVKKWKLVVYLPSQKDYSVTGGYYRSIFEYCDKYNYAPEICHIIPSSMIEVEED
jgi:hypothetical protein